MDTKFQTSFIPKKPVVMMADAPISVKKPVNMISLISTAIFVLGVLATAGVFVYERYLNAQIDTMEQKLVAAKSSFETDLFNDFVKLDRRISTAEELLGSHIAVSLFFDALQDSTVREVQFKDFNYKAEPDGTITVFMRGEATGYNAIALQSEKFKDNKYILQPLFSDLDLDDSGNVLFSFRANLDSAIVAHRNRLNSAVFSYDMNDNVQ